MPVTLDGDSGRGQQQVHWVTFDASAVDPRLDLLLVEDGVQAPQQVRQGHLPDAYKYERPTTSKGFRPSHPAPVYARVTKEQTPSPEDVVRMNAGRGGESRTSSYAVTK